MYIYTYITTVRLILAKYFEYENYVNRIIIKCMSRIQYELNPITL